MSPPSGHSLPPPAPSHPSRLSQSLSLISLVIQQIPTVLHKLVYMSPRCSLHGPTLSSLNSQGSVGLDSVSSVFSSVTQSCLTLSDPIDCSPPGSSIHGIFQARILEWVAIAFSPSIHDYWKNHSFD